MIKLNGGYTISVNADKTMLSVFSRTSVYVYSLPDFNKLHRISTVQNISAAVISPNGALIAIRNSPGTLSVFDMELEKLVGVSRVSGVPGDKLMFSKDSTLLYVIDIEGNVSVVKLDNMESDIIYTFRRGMSVAFDAYRNAVIGTKRLSNDVTELSLTSGDVRYFSAAKLTSGFFGLDDASYSATMNIFATDDRKIAITDKNFSELSRFSTIAMFPKPVFYDNERAVVVTDNCQTAIYDTATLVRQCLFLHKYTSDAYLMDSGSIVIATWCGTFVHEGAYKRE